MHTLLIIALLSKPSKHKSENGSSFVTKDKKSFWRIHGTQSLKNTLECRNSSIWFYLCFVKYNQLFSLLFFLSFQHTSWETNQSSVTNHLSLLPLWKANFYISFKKKKKSYYHKRVTLWDLLNHQLKAELCLAASGHEQMN